MSNPVFSRCEARENEQVVFFYCPVTKLKAIVAIHNTTLGPALGGCRSKSYGSEEEALEDVVRLAEAMTYKNSVADLDLGGGKACIIGDRFMEKGRKELFQKFGECLNTLGGRYYTATDIGTSLDDLDAMKSQSQYVTGASKQFGGSEDPSPWTALGVFNSIKKVADQKLQRPLSELRVAIEGAGRVGQNLAKLLSAEGVKLFISDTHPETLDQLAKQIYFQSVELGKIYDVDCDIFAPAAVGQTVNHETVAMMKCGMILGPANNQLSEQSVYNALKEKHILYCPDFVVNAGGVISVGAELLPGGWNKEWVEQKTLKIADTILNILELSEKENKFTDIVALEIAKKRIEQES